MALVSTTGTLGNLTPQEKQKLQQAWIHLLRLCGVHNLENPSVPNLSDDLSSQLKNKSPEAFKENLWGFILAEHPDALILRFLRARKWDVEKAMMMLVSAINWRDERDIMQTIIHSGEDVALKDNPSEDEKAFITQYGSGKSYVHGTDKEHRLVYIIKVRLHDPKLQSPQAMESYILHNIESLRVLMHPPNDKCCLIFDLTGFGLKNMDFHVVKFLTSVFEARYPETLGLILIHNAPFVFWGVWSLIKGWLDPVIASKIHFTRKSADLLQFIAPENLQTSFGGKDQYEYEYIKPVPGENAKLEEHEEREKIKSERQQLIHDLEVKTTEWASLEPNSAAVTEVALDRTKLAAQLSEVYWKLDPYIRAKTLNSRAGIVIDGGTAHRSETQSG
ncbi:CRAL/TRIO domain-containing protein [Xylariaceae sp. FL1272]|nr:CRAL/TRIO domain-containing protein [Xylariaceae sp. FL1272]